MPSDLRPRSQLHPFQERGARWLVDHEAAGLFMDVGLGKTATALTAIADLIAAGTIRRILVIGPPRVIASVWAKEAAAWEHTRHLQILALTGSPDDRRDQLRSRLQETDIVCISFALLSWLHRTVKREVWDLVLVDESSQIKNPSTKRWKACAYAAVTARRRAILTGTPTPKSLADLWGQVSMADLGERFGRSHYGFLRRYFADTEAGWKLRKGSGKQIMAKLRDFAIAMQAKDYLDLPGLVENRIDVDLPRSAWRVYEDLADTFAAKLASGAEIDVANAGVMAGKLQQVAQGALFTDEGHWEELHAAKLEAVTDLVSELSGEPVIVAYWYRHDLQRLRQRFPEATVLGDTSPRQLQVVIDRWNEGDIPVLLLHPASAGHGLNLQAGGRHIVWMALPWSWELTHQTIARLHRQGQSKPVMVHRIVAGQTIDERILDVVAQRQGGHEAVVTALKADVAAHRSKPQAPCTASRSSAQTPEIGCLPC